MLGSDIFNHGHVILDEFEEFNYGDQVFFAEVLDFVFSAFLEIFDEFNQEVFQEDSNDYDDLNIYEILAVQKLLNYK